MHCGCCVSHLCNTFLLVLLLLLTQSLDMIDDEVSCLGAVCGALPDLNLLFLLTNDLGAQCYSTLSLLGRERLYLFTSYLRGVPGSRGSKSHLQSPSFLSHSHYLTWSALLHILCLPLSLYPPLSSVLQ